MQVYSDTNNGTELFSSVYKIDLIDDVIYEVEGKTVTVSEDMSNLKIGANASVEEAAEDTETSTISGPDFVLNGRLHKMETPLTKMQYKLYLKNHYFKSIPTLTGEKQKMLGAYLTKLWPIFKKFDQYVGEGQVVDTDDNKFPMVCLLNYRDDTDNPYMICYKDGLAVEKV